MTSNLLPSTAEALPLFVILWRFRSAPGRDLDFERAYGAGGDWARFFAAGPGYLGTDLLRGADGVYITIDRWTGEEAYEAFRREHRDRYEAIDRTCEALTAEETLLGRFSEPG